MEARQRDAGVVGSTQNILDFIALKLNEALEKPFAERLQVGVIVALRWQRCSFVVHCQLCMGDASDPCLWCEDILGKAHTCTLLCW